MSVQYKIRQLAVSTALDYWDNICQNVAPALVHTMPTFDNVNLKNLRPYWFLVDANAMGLQTIDGSLFNINGATAYTVSTPGLYKFEYVEGRWYMTSTDMVPTSNDLKLENVIHVAKNGDDALAALSVFAPFSIKFPYLTIEAAHLASTPNHTLMVWPGKYTMTASLDFDGSKARKIYHQPGVTITSFQSDYQYKITPLETAYILGYPDYNMKFPLVANTAPGTDIAFLEWEYGNIVNDSGGSFFQAGTFASLKGRIRGRTINEIYFSANGWNQIDFQVDEWVVATSGMLYFDDPNSFGAQFTETYGPSQFNLSGFSKEFAMLNKPVFSGTGQAFINIQAGGRACDRLINLNAHFRTLDGPGIQQDAAIIRWKGDAYHTKSNLVGNEMPFYVAINPTTEQQNKPMFEHWGTVVMYPRVDEGYTFMNCTLFDIRCAGEFIWHGNYKSSGVDELSLGTPFPVVSVTNQDVDGITKAVFDGIFMTSRDAAVGPLRINETGAGVNELQAIFLNNIAICENLDKQNGPIYSTTLRPTLLYVYHSLALNGRIDETIFTNFMSNNRMYYDTSVMYRIPEYIE